MLPMIIVKNENKTILASGFYMLKLSGEGRDKNMQTYTDSATKSRRTKCHV